LPAAEGAMKLTWSMSVEMVKPTHKRLLIYNRKYRPGVSMPILVGKTFNFGEKNEKDHSMHYVGLRSGGTCNFGPCCRNRRFRIWLNPSMFI
jgi:hypothetical protein